MLYLAIGLVLLMLVLIFGRRFLAADVKILARNMRKTGGILALAGAAALLVTGRAALAVPLFILAMSLLGRSIGFPWGLGPSGRAEKSPGQTSTVRTPMIEMELDHDTGEMRGRVLAGRYAGRELGGMELDEVVALWRECRAADGQGAQLLEAVLDRSAPSWRETYGAGGAEAGASEAARGGGKMTAGEAYEVLGLAPGASRAGIQQAHRELMKRFHPDQGGSNYLAAKINEAKDVLLARTPAL